MCASLRPSHAAALLVAELEASWPKSLRTTMTSQPSGPPGSPARCPVGPSRKRIRCVLPSACLRPPNARPVPRWARPSDQPGVAAGRKIVGKADGNRRTYRANVVAHWRANGVVVPALVSVRRTRLDVGMEYVGFAQD